MIWSPFKIISKKSLGIDIGTSSIRIVELSRLKEKINLKNYGEVNFLTLTEKPFRTFEKNNVLLSSQDIANAIRAIFEETKITTREAIFSIPDFSSFFTNFEIPSMSEKELAEAVKFEARHHIPLPLSEVVLDWSIIEGKNSDQKESKLKILLVAVPYDVIHQYQKIAQLSQIRLLGLEAEVFGLVRSLIKKNYGIIGLIDIGAQSTTVSIVEKGILKITYSFDVSGNEFTRLLSKSLNISYNEAEELKKKMGLWDFEKKVERILAPLFNIIIGEIEKVATNFQQAEGKEMEKLIIAGGSALFPGLKEYFSDNLKKPVEIANPFVDISYPPILKEHLKEIGPSYAIAVGMALRGVE